MNSPLTEHDLIQLNAYLDEELSGEERADFEHRLARDTALQAELRAIRATKMLLGMAERQRVPRNFTLDPAQYAKPARPSLWERLGLTGIPTWATAGAALVAVALCVGVFILSDLGPSVTGLDVAMEPAAAPVGGEADGLESAAEEAPAAEAFSVEEAAEESAAGAVEAPVEDMTAQEETARAAAPPGMGGIPDAPTVVGPSEEEEALIQAAPAAGEAEDTGEADEGAAGLAQSAGPAAPQPTPEIAEAEIAAAPEDVEQPETATTLEAARTERDEAAAQPRTGLVVGLGAAVVAALALGVWLAFKTTRRR